MVILQYSYGGEIAEWDEHLYHRSFSVQNGRIETDDELAIEALLHRGWELVDEPEATPPAPTRSSRKTELAAEKG